MDACECSAGTLSRPDDALRPGGINSVLLGNAAKPATFVARMRQDCDMTHFRILIPLLLVGTGAMAAGSIAPDAAIVPDAGQSLRLLTPRDASPVETPPLTDTYRCEPVLRIDEGTPVAFLPNGDVSGRESRRTSRFCET